jgi:Mu-like prophage protein Com
MVDQPGGRGKHDPDVIRLSYQYASCPTCQLVLPLYDDPDGAAGDRAGADDRGPVLPPVQVVRCGLCKRPLATATTWPLDLKLRCPDCGTLIRAPTEAAVLACPGCDSYFANPGNSPEIRQRVREIVAEQARIAALVNDLDRRLEQALAQAERQRAALAPLMDLCSHQPADPGGWPGVCLLPAGHPGPHGLPFWQPPPRHHERIRVPEAWIDRARPLPAVFAEAFTTAVQSLDAPRERLVAELRYGLDGVAGRTFRQIGHVLGRSPVRARQLLWNAVHSIALAPLGPDPTWSPSRRACGIAVHLATDVLGDPTDSQTPARLRAFIDEAMPQVRPQVSARLLVELADLVELEVDLRAWGRDQALCRAVAAVPAT